MQSCPAFRAASAGVGPDGGELSAAYSAGEFSYDEKDVVLSPA
jgi:hypothetical protein